MKKMILIIAMMFVALNLQAGKVTGPDDNGRIYNTAYFDVKSDTQATVYDVITYSKRAGTFNWEKVYKSLHNFNADKIEYIIKTRIEVPQDITTPSVYITIGDNYYFRYLTDNGQYSTPEEDTKLKPTSEEESWNYSSLIVLSTKINDQAIQSGTVILTKTKKDTFGNRYVDLEISFFLDVADKGKATSRKIIGTIVKNNLSSKLDTIKIKIAPKSRTFQSKWVEPKIYVLDE